MGVREVVINARVSIPINELQFRTSRSGGPGGQHVNKVESKVELLFDAQRSRALDDATRARVLAYLQRTGREDGILRLTSQESRSQWENKQRTLERLAEELRRALRPVRLRRATSPTKSSQIVRREAKQRRGAVKRLRQKPPRHDE